MPGVVQAEAGQVSKVGGIESPQRRVLHQRTGSYGKIDLPSPGVSCFPIEFRSLRSHIFPEGYCRFTGEKRLMGKQFLLEPRTAQPLVQNQCGQ